MVSTDLRFYFDPICPFCWMTSKWIRLVAPRRDLAIDWRFISLRLINENVDYAAHFPAEYEASHTAGLRLLRVAARTRHDEGPEALDALQAALGHRIFDTAPREDSDTKSGPQATRTFVEPILAAAGLPASLAEALDDDSWDATIRAEGSEARALTGDDVGTPIIHFDPPDGTAFFGPVISRLPDPDQAVELWDHVIGLTRFPGFAELKRSLRERPQLVAFGVDEGDVGVEEDWQAGRRPEPA